MRNVSSASGSEVVRRGHRRAGGGQQRAGRLDHGGDLVVHLERAAEVHGQGDPQAAERPGDGAARTRARVAEGQRGPRVGAGEHREEQGEVVDVARHRPADRGRLPLVVGGHCGTRPSEGRSPTTPQNDAGLRSEPPMSEPSASGTIPDASAHAAPPQEPPADRVGSTGLRVVPKIVLNVCEPAANSGTLVLPITGPRRGGPARRSARRGSARGPRTAASRTSSASRRPRGCP